MITLSKKILYPVVLLLTATFGLVACGPDLKNVAIEVAPESVEFGEIKLNTPAKKEVTITGKELSAAITLSLEGVQASSFELNTKELAKEGGKVEVTAKADAEGEFAATLKVVSGAITKSIPLKAKVVSSGVVNDSDVKFSAGESITELAFSVKFPANYPGLEPSERVRIDGNGGEVGESVKLSLEGANADMFTLTATEIKDNKKKSTPAGFTNVVFKATKAGEYTAELVATYAGKTHRLPIKAKAIVGRADEIILVEPALPPSRMKASLFGKDLPNGATVKVHTVMMNEGSEYVPLIDLELPEGVAYTAKASYEKNFTNGVQWCMGSSCVGRDGNVNPFVYDQEIPSGKLHLSFHFPYPELVSGYKNKITYTFTGGGDSYVLYIEFDVD